MSTPAQTFAPVLTNRLWLVCALLLWIGCSAAYFLTAPGRIDMSGRRAALYVNGASQPCLIVNDLKLGETHGSVALWAHSTTDAYFSRVVLRPE